jgi:uncharacterized protein (TIGR02145 family)
LFCTCENVLDNPYDLDCPPELWTPTDLNAESQDNSIALNWNLDEDHFDGYWIEVSNNAKTWDTIHSTIVEPEQKAFTDTGLYPGKTIQYRIHGRADQNQSDYAYSNELTLSANAPLVSTDSTGGITEKEATLYGNVVSNGGSTVTERGFCYSTSPNVDINDTKVTSGAGTGSFNETLSGLQAGTTYYVKAYAINSAGTAYGDEVSLTTEEETIACGDLETFTDPRDGHEYKMTQIGEQVWMAENLAYLPNVSPSSAESYTDPYYYVYDYQGTSVSAAKATDNYETYGVLYNWPAAMNACPSGWHLPSPEEWEVLSNYAGGLDSGEKLKTSDGWISDFFVGTNEYCFSAVPSGGRVDYGLPGDGEYEDLYYNAWFWCDTEKSATLSYCATLLHNNSMLHGDFSRLKEDGYSVRCIRD